MIALPPYRQPVLGAAQVAPDLQDIVETPHRAALAPQHQQRAAHLLRAVRARMLQINRGARAVVLARRVDRGGVGEAPEILRKRLGRERIRAAGRPQEPRSYFLLSLRFR